VRVRGREADVAEGQGMLDWNMCSQRNSHTSDVHMVPLTPSCMHTCIRRYIWHVMMCVHVRDGKTCLEIAFERRHEDVVEHLCGLKVKTLVRTTMPLD